MRRADGTAANKEAFLTQISTKVGAFKANRDKGDERLGKEKATHDQLRCAARACKHRSRPPA